MEDGNIHSMDEKDKKLLKRESIYTKEQLMDFFSNISLPEGVSGNYIEKDNCIEFIYEDTIYSALISGENWEDTKQEMLQQKERRLKESFQIKELEKKDSLTKLYNKAYNKQIIEGFLRESKPGSRHALMIVDIDNFETVNENLGYLFGDTVLVNIADKLREIFYDTDVAGRIGGDEFLIFLKNVTSLELLQLKAEEINSVFRNTYTGENRNYKMSCSIGIASYPGDGMYFMDLFTKADAALMYTRETKGRFYNFYENTMAYNKYIDGLCYEKYKITKTRAYGSNNFDKEITAFAFDIMSRTKDVNSAINLLLNKVRVQFGCNHICIIENDFSETDYKITYFSGKDEIRTKASKQKIAMDFSDLPERFDENGIFYINDVNSLNSDSNKIKALGLRAILQCGIFENGTFKGCVSIHDSEKPRYWTQYEVDSLVTLTKIISSYLLKMRASERASQQLYQIKNFDLLTGLPTLHKFKKDVKQLLDDNPKVKYAIVCSDLTQFKYINNTLGYDTGDKILYDFAALLNGDIYKEGLARISEDNFVVIYKFTNEDALKNHILKLNEQFNVAQKAKYPGNKFIIASGASLMNASEDITTAIDNANIARKSIKNCPKTYCKFFDHSMKEKLQKEAEITNNMEQALKDREFIVYLQPKIGLNENKLVGAEALVRWKKPDNTIIQPNDFIPIFEKNGFVVNLDFFIYEEVCKIIREWSEQGIPLVPISINVSRVHLDDENFVRDIKKLVDSYEIPYQLLEMELTESIFLNNTEVALTTMKELRSLGFGVSIDDFGAGYSSLNLLKDMATDVIKLDKEFFGNGIMQKEEQIIVSSIISMAKQLNMKVLSEGVETKNQSDFLKSVLCDMAQGYLYSKPIPVEDFVKLILEQSEKDNHN